MTGIHTHRPPREKRNASCLGNQTDRTERHKSIACNCQHTRSIGAFARARSQSKIKSIISCTQFCTWLLHNHLHSRAQLALNFLGHAIMSRVFAPTFQFIFSSCKSPDDAILKSVYTFWPEWSQNEQKLILVKIEVKWLTQAKMCDLMWVPSLRLFNSIILHDIFCYLWLHTMQSGVSKQFVVQRASRSKLDMTSFCLLHSIKVHNKCETSKFSSTFSRKHIFKRGNVVWVASF
jgi:hypothetical protein